MRFNLRILKIYDNQQIPSCFLTAHGQNKSYTYAFNTPADVYKEWHYFGFAKSEIGFRVFFTRFQLSHISGIFGLVTNLEHRESLDKFQFFGCNRFMKYFELFKYFFGIKILKLSAASLEDNKQDFVGLSNKDQINTLITNLDEKISIFDNMRKLFKRETLNAAKDQLIWDEENKQFYYQDEQLKVYAIDIYSQSDQSIKQQNTKKYAFHVQEELPDRKTIDKEKFNKDIPIKFRSHLIKNKIVQIDNVVYDLKNYELPEGQSHFLVLEIKTEEELDQFLNNSYVSGNLFSQLDMIVHLSSKEMLELPKYTQFIKNNHHLKHVITACGYNSKNDMDDINILPFSFLSFNMQLSKLFPHILPIMNPSYFFAFQKGINNQNVPFEDAPFYKERMVRLIRPQQSIHIKKNEIKHIFLPPTSFSFNKDLNSTLQNDILYQKLYQKLKNFNQNKMKDLAHPKFSQNYYPEIISLGTSSSQCTVFRHLSSYLIKVKENSTIMLDCGYGTVYQLQKQFATFDEFEFFKQVQKIKMIVISHLHSDHHYGLVEFLEMRNVLYQKYDTPIPKIPIVLPNSIYKYLNVLESLNEQMNMILIPHSNVSNFTTNKANKHFKDIQKIIKIYKQDNTDNDDNVLDFCNDENDEDSKIEQLKGDHQKIFHQTLEQIGIKKLVLFPIYHCQGSRSILMHTYNNKKIVYSGDGRPSTRFNQLIQDADILIHECTFTREQRLQATIKSHSFFDEVVEFAHSLNVKCLILSHFSTNSTEKILANQIQNIDYSFLYPQSIELQNYINKQTIFAVDHLVMNEQNIQALTLASRMILKIYSI